ncbi:MAG: Radical domain protein [Fluviicola sp.]|jgi:radical SAM protein with 4Fe4S-binding SPASM domain|uniref:radical SAM/SPASM domain-containing protein n=1 Tax=Fluviicola sp. TaxID=1917219 RepID=UPI00263623C1|nr:radical SAM/SPASM domain-containing protein [Fluviicola sp.]MDF3027445.1 Radical domain protein [Fluviicola sp.]
MSTFKDQRNIIKHLNIQRVWNIVMLRFSYGLARLFKIQKNWGKPFALSIEPTTACNLGCPACPSGLKAFSRPTGKIDLVNHQNWLSQVANSVFYINYYFQGEPFLHPQFLDLIREAKRKKIYTATSTNAHFIDEKKAQEIVESGLDRLIISIDGLTQETYESYRVHGNLEKVIAGSKALVQAKQTAQSATPHLIFQFLVVKANEHQIAEVQELATEIGIDEVRFKTAQVYDYEHGNELIPDNEAYSRYVKQKDGTYRFKYKGGNSCWRMWSSSVLTWDGQVVPCCFDKDAHHTLGSLQEQTFETIWKSPAYRSFRNSVLQDRNSIEICTNCSEGAKVWID